MTGGQLIGRERELSALAAEAKGDAGSVLVVLGEPGIGKTSLLRATGATARRAGCRVLSSTGVEARGCAGTAGWRSRGNRCARR
jgi:ABC-type transport system involved in cytochrome c biogenesis ATPase subunit